jgi:hypothetical protein
MDGKDMQEGRWGEKPGMIMQATTWVWQREIR